MAKINDRYQLTQYGQEVQQAIDNALIYLPQELALKAYKDEVLLKNQTTPYEPTQNYHPATKLYVDTANNATNQRLDAETARAQAAEKVLNEKQVLTFDEKTTSYKYLNLVNIDRATQALVDENALDRKLAELAVGFFMYMKIDETNGDILEGRYEPGVNPYAVVEDENQLPPSNVPAGAIGITLNNESSINVYKYSNNAWTELASPAIENGWLFASTIDGKGYYWFVNTWNLIDMNVDMSQYYNKIETDDILKSYVLKNELHAIPNLTSNNGSITITGTGNNPRNIEVTNGIFQNIIAAGTDDDILTRSANVGQLNTLKRITIMGTSANDWSNDNIPSEKAVGDYVTNAIDNISMNGFQTVIPGGTAYNIVAYSGKAGELNTLTRATTINATLGSTSDTKIPTEKATATYVQNYKPVIITQGNANTSVTTSQLTFWIEQ